MSLSAVLETFHSTLSELEFISEIPDKRIFQELIRETLILFNDKISLETSRQPSTPLIIVVCGGTNTGKSSIINWLAGTEVTAASALARGTKTPVICGNRSAVSQLENNWHAATFRVISPGHSSDSLEAHSGNVVFKRDDITNIPQNCVLIDSPDFDSNHSGNRLWAERLLTLSDAVILIATPEKYNDAAVVDHIRKASEMKRTMGTIFNKIEGPEAPADYRKNVWKSPGNIIAIPRFSVGSQPDANSVRSIYAMIDAWSQRKQKIKQAAIQGTLQTLQRKCHCLADRLRLEESWLTELRESVDSRVKKMLDSYRKELKSEKFVEIDIVFRRIWDQYRIWILDDVYGALRKGSALMFRRLKSLFGRSDGVENYRKKRDTREKQRISMCIEMLHDSLLKLPGQSPPPLKELVRNRIAEWNENLVTPDIRGFITECNAEVDKWVSRETMQIIEKMEKHPGFRRFFISGKALFQISFGVLGAYLTGGFSPTDVVWGPLLERLAAYLMEAGLGKAYFINRRRELLNLRTEWMRNFIETTMLNDLRSRFPLHSTDQAEKLIQAVNDLVMEVQP